MNNKNAVALLIVMSLLGLLLFVTFGTLMLTGLSSAQGLLFNFNVKSTMAAESAMNFAIASLIDWIKKHPKQSLYEEWEFYGEDLNMNTKLDDFEDTNSNKLLDKLSANLETALHPSFVKVSKRGVSNVVVVNNKPQLVSGILELSSHYMIGYSIKVADSSGLLNINSKSSSLPLILNNLLEYLNLNIDIKSILANAPYSSYDGLKKILGKSNFNILRNFLTIYGKDKNVLRYTTKKSLQGKQSVTNLMDLYPVQKGKEYTINLNINSIDTALFFATLNNLEGVSFLASDYSYEEFPVIQKEQLRFNLYPILFNPTKLTPVLGKLKQVKIEKKVATDLAEFFDEKKYDLKTETFNKVLTENLWNPISFFSNYESFVDFINQAVDSKIIDISQKKLILANARDFLNLELFYPEANDKTLLDKYMVIQKTAEFTFFPDGIFELETMGVIYGKDNNVISKSFKESVVNIFDVEYLNVKENKNNFQVNGMCFTENGEFLYISLCTRRSAFSKNSIFYIDFGSNFDAEVGDKRKKPITLESNSKTSYPTKFVNGAFFDSFSSLEYSAEGILPFEDTKKDSCKEPQDDKDKDFLVCKYLKGSFYFWIKPYYSFKDFNGFQNIFSISQFKKEYFDNFKLSDTYLFSFMVIPQNIISIYNKDIQNPVIFTEIPAIGGEEFIAGVDGKVDYVSNLWNLYVIKFDTSTDKVKNYVDIYLNGTRVGREIFYNYDMEVKNKGLMVDYAKDANTIVFGYHNNAKRLWNFHLHGILGEFGIMKYKLSEAQIKEYFNKGRFDIQGNSITIPINPDKRYVRLFWEESKYANSDIPQYKLQLLDDKKTIARFDIADSYVIDINKSTGKNIKLKVENSGAENLKYMESFVYKIGLIYLNFYLIK